MWEFGGVGWAEMVVVSCEEDWGAKEVLGGASGGRGVGEGGGFMRIFFRGTVGVVEVV